MIKNRAHHLFTFLLLVLLLSYCVEPFHSSIPSNDIRLLVVEGYINAGPGESVIRLSRVTPLGEEQQVMPENNAAVSIRSNQNEIYALAESENGVYRSGELNLPLDREFSLDIRLQGGQQYQSPFLPVKVTPPIDSISWEWGDALDIFVNTHDTENSTYYYQWQFEEDWQIQAQRVSELMWADDTVKPRPLEEAQKMFNCWQSAKSMGLILGSTKNLVSDNMKFRLKQLAKGGWETSVRYSILVTQHALYPEEYDYLKLMEKNTSELGSFFDPMPSELYGNIQNMADPEEKVIGYVGVYTTESKRLFIRNSELPLGPTNFDCLTHEIRLIDADTVEEYIVRQHYVPIRTYLDIEAYVWMTAMELHCLDCRVFGGNEKPEWW